MKFIIKIFHSFFLSKLLVFFKMLTCIFVVLGVFSKNLFAENISILDRLPTSIFATVNGEAISVYDLILRSNIFSFSAKIPIDDNFKMNILPELISGLIDEKIQEQEMKKNGVVIPKNQIAEAIKTIEKENEIKEGELEKVLAENNTDIAILEKQIEVSIGWRQLIANLFRGKITVLESETERVHNNLKSSIGKKEFFIEQIFISFETRNEKEAKKRIENLHNQINQGADFLSIAKQFSESFSGKVGRIGWVSEVDLDLEIIDKVKQLKINQMSEPIKGSNGYYIIKINDRRTIGEDVIREVSLFQIELIEKNNENELNLEKISNCEDLETFSKENGTADSGALGYIKFNELSKDMRNEIKRIDKNKISRAIVKEDGEYRFMACDIKKNKPMVPSKFKIEEILFAKKLDTISLQFMVELRAKSIIDIKI